MRTLLVQALYGLRSERQMMERLDFDLLLRWFLGLGIDDLAWHSTVYAKNRDRLLEGAVAERLLIAILVHPKVGPLLSWEHRSVEGAHIEAWDLVKSFQPKGQDDFHGERRSNATHASTTDPDARLFRKGRGKEAKLAYMSHLLTENRNGLIVDVRTTRAHGNAETLAAADMLAARARRPGMTVGADKGYDTADFGAELRELGITPTLRRMPTIPARPAGVLPLMI